MAKHPVPKKKTSKSSRDSRRAHHALSAPNLVSCANCGSKKISYTVCPECGYYGGKQILEIDS
ncbi:MAG: 50S ribosomal protein L32 [Deinococcales bacterium]